MNAMLKDLNTTLLSLSREASSEQGVRLSIPGITSVSPLTFLRCAAASVVHTLHFPSLKRYSHMYHV